MISEKSGTKVDVSDLHRAAFSAAGTEDLSAVSSVSFIYSVQSADGKSHHYDVVLVPIAK
jgi:predicted lactoylglutathione lyase